MKFSNSLPHMMRQRPFKTSSKFPHRSPQRCVFRLGSWGKDARRQSVDRSWPPLEFRRVRLQFTAPRRCRLGRRADAFPPVLLLNGQAAALGEHSARPCGIRRVEGKPLRLPHQDRAAPRGEIAGPPLAELPEELLRGALLGPGEGGEGSAERGRLAVGFECGDSGHLLFSSVSMMRSNDHPR